MRIAGPLLLQDYHLTEMYGSFDRERIPERVVHARGGLLDDIPCSRPLKLTMETPAAGAHGCFEVTNADFAKNYTMM